MFPLLELVNIFVILPIVAVLFIPICIYYFYQNIKERIKNKRRSDRIYQEKFKGKEIKSLGN